VTSDGGESWGTQLPPVSFDIVDVDMVGGQFGWALAQQYPSDTSTAFGTTVIRTTNGGSAWVVQSTFEEFLHTVDFTDSARGCLGGDLGKLLWTSNGGRDWTEAVVDSPDFAHWPVRDFEFHTGNYGLAMGGLYDVTGLVWRTTDGGHFWTHTRVAGEPFFGAWFHDSLDIVCVGGDLDYGAGMVRTSSGGAQWEYTYLGIWGQASAVSFRTPSEGWSPLGFAGTYMYTLDSGSTWTAMYTPDTTAMRDVVFTDSNTGYMVGDAGTVLKYVGSATPVGGPDLVSAARGGFLLQNRPNPFNPSTRLAFRVPEIGFVSLKVYDPGGREVATLVSEELAPGDYTRTFDGGNLPSGVYYYRLAAAGLVETRKMVLVR
jgi:photosystem II stability/assembly factor-like uncharacterized protein